MTRRFRLLAAFVDASSYDASVKAFFREGAIAVENDCVRFGTSASVNSYTVAQLTAFLSAEHVRQGMSFSQETVFSHPSKVAALAAGLPITVLQNGRVIRLKGETKK